jgi:hypothetical protein
MMGDRYERPEGSGKAPMDPDAAFMQVIRNLVISQHAMNQSLAQMANRLTTWSIPGTNAPQEAQGNSRTGNRPHLPTRTYTSLNRIPRPLFPSFQRAPPAAIQQPIASRQTTQEEDISEYKREYAALGPKFH